MIDCDLDRLLATRAVSRAARSRRRGIEGDPRDRSRSSFTGPTRRSPRLLNPPRSRESMTANGLPPENEVDKEAPFTATEFHCPDPASNQTVVERFVVDLPPNQRRAVPARRRVTMGETYDMGFTPAAPGDFRLELRTGDGRLIAHQPIRVVPRRQ